MVIQYNKRDLPNVASLAELHALLNRPQRPRVRGGGHHGDRGLRDAQGGHQAGPDRPETGRTAIGFETHRQHRLPRELEGTDLSPYDAVCLGSPYCRRVEGNYAEALDLLPGVVSSLHAAGKRAYVTTPAVPREADLPTSSGSSTPPLPPGRTPSRSTTWGSSGSCAKKGGRFRPTWAPTRTSTRTSRPGSCATRGGPGASQRRGVPRGDGDPRPRDGGRGRGARPREDPPRGHRPLLLLTEPEESDPKCPSACGEVHWLTSRQWVLKTVGKGVLSGRTCACWSTSRDWSRTASASSGSRASRDRGVPVGDRRRLPGGAGPGLWRRGVQARGSVG